MAIRVQCSCGKKVLVTDDQAGRMVRCPTCQGMVALPGKPKAAPSYGVEPVRTCPGCKRDWPPDTVLCIDCGYNFATGRKKRTKYNILGTEIDVGVVWLGCYKRYRIFRNARGKPSLSISRRILFLPLGSRTYDLSDYRAILTGFWAGYENDPDAYFLRLQDRDKRTVTIFVSADEEKMKELVDVIAQAGKLEIKRE